MSEVLLDRAGRRRSPATLPGFHAGRSPRNKGLRSVYLQGMDNAEIIDTVHTRRAPMIPVSTSLRI
jgi:hypothetical protein